MFCDYHVHCEFSDDSLYDMEDCVKDAISINMQEICFTDHVDYGVKKDWSEGNIQYRSGDPLANVDYPKYFEKLAYLKEKYQDQIVIKQGMEFGVQHHTIDKYENLFKKYDLDFVILSIHQVNDKEFWNYEFQKESSEAEFYQAYYDEMYRVVQNYHHYSVLGHMDMLKRYDNKDGYDAFKNHQDIITKILKYIIADGKGIEVNTSSFRYGLDDLMPSKEILKLYLSLGGKILTIGSDSHEKNHLLNSNIENVKKILKEIGFTQYCTFEKMKPIYHSL
ncbi:histidinol-phosphatase HisJ family protein, partial [Thomasclavelia sp.]|uniref:histidinol-phosphatase HisJ family protein n=1 Tax=Thomasclavelia sp. TaxID=3025757 RepID=UPI0025FDC80F